MQNIFFTVPHGPCAIFETLARETGPAGEFCNLQRGTISVYGIPEDVCGSNGWVD